MRALSRSLVVLLSFAVAIYALAAYSLAPLGAAVHPDMYAGFVARPSALYVHVFSASLALLLGPLQFSTRLRAAQPVLHRWIGRALSLRWRARRRTVGVVPCSECLRRPRRAARFRESRGIVAIHGRRSVSRDSPRRHRGTSSLDGAQLRVELGRGMRAYTCQRRPSRVPRLRRATRSSPGYAGCRIWCSLSGSGGALQRRAVNRMHIVC